MASHFHFSGFVECKVSIKRLFFFVCFHSIARINVGNVHFCHHRYVATLHFGGHLVLSPIQLETFPTFGWKYLASLPQTRPEISSNLIKQENMLMTRTKHDVENTTAPKWSREWCFLLKKKEQGRRNVTVFIWLWIQYKTHICHVSTHNQPLKVFHPVLFFSSCSWGKCNPRRQPFKSHKSPVFVGKCLQMKLLYTN